MADLKINHGYVENYSEVFAETVCLNYFKSEAAITGKQILQLTPSKQVNFMVLKNLYTRWQDETKKLESPFFDFKQEKVRAALLKFMNTVSQHIHVDRDHFQPLLKEAVQDTIYLTFSPYDFFLAEISLKNQKKIGIKSFKSIEKYLKTNKPIFDDFIGRLEEVGPDKIDTDDALQILGSLFEEDPQLDDSAAFVEEISKILVFDASVFEVVEKTAVSSDLEETITSTEEKEASFEPEPVDDMEVEDIDDIQIEEESDEEEHPSVEGSPIAEETDSFVEEQEESLDEDEDLKDLKTLEDLEGEDVIQDDPESVNSKFSEESVMLNEKLQQSEEEVSIADHHANKKVENVLGSISVNQRYSFINDLFQGDNDQFNVALDKIEACKTFDDSVEVLVNGYAKKYEWDMSSDTVKELLKMVFRKFR